MSRRHVRRCARAPGHRRGLHGRARTWVRTAEVGRSQLRQAGQGRAGRARTATVQQQQCSKSTRTAEERATLTYLPTNTARASAGARPHAGGNRCAGCQAQARTGTGVGTGSGWQQRMLVRESAPTNEGSGLQRAALGNSDLLDARCKGACVESGDGRSCPKSGHNRTTRKARPTTREQARQGGRRFYTECCGRRQARRGARGRRFRREQQRAGGLRACRCLVYVLLAASRANASESTRLETESRACGALPWSTARPRFEAPRPAASALPEHTAQHSTVYTAHSAQHAHARRPDGPWTLDIGIYQGSTADAVPCRSPSRGEHAAFVPAPVTAGETMVHCVWTRPVEPSDTCFSHFAD